MKSAAIFATAFALGSCSLSGSSVQHVQFAHLAFDLPGDWHAANSTRRGLSTSIWTPEDNDHKESVTVIRSERSPAVAKSDPGTLESLLASAQIPGSRISSAKLVTTSQGLSGARVDVDYTPPGMRATYRRVHVVLVDGSSLIHVLYTA